MVNHPTPQETAPMWWLMEQVLAMEPGTRNGGIYNGANRSYHNTRDNVVRYHGGWDVYTVASWRDRGGPSDKATAMDWTFVNAQAGNFSTISIYGARLYTASINHDPRMYGVAEWFGQADGDRQVEGWFFLTDSFSSSDDSHLWHLHIAFWRTYADSWDAIKAVLSVLRGESLAQWHAQQQPDPEDVMPDLGILPLPLGFAADENGNLIDRSKALVLPVPPENSGGLPWGDGFASFVSDFGEYKIRLAYHYRLDNGTKQWDAEMKLVRADASREENGVDFPKYSGKLSICRMKITADDTESWSVPGGVLIEYGVRR